MLLLTIAVLSLIICLCRLNAKYGRLTRDAIKENGRPNIARFMTSTPTAPSKDPFGSYHLFS